MNYCFNCGTKIIEEEQKFCIKCGANLVKHEEKYKEYLKEPRKKYNPREWESYYDYLKRINSPLKDDIATKEEIESESYAYRNYNPHNEYDEEYSQPKTEAEEIISPQIDIYENEREYISEGMFGKPSSSRDGNYIREGMFGKPEYYIDGDIIREKNQFGKPAYRIDGNYVREGMFGKPKYYIDGDLIRENNQFGKVVGRRKKFNHSFK